MLTKTSVERWFCAWAASLSKISSHMPVLVTELSSSAGNFDGDVELAALAYLDDGGGLAVWMDAGEEVGDEFDGVLGGGEADSLRRRGEAREELAGAETVFAGDEGVEAFEREGEMGAAFVVGYGVDFVDDDCADAAEVLPAICQR